MRGGHLPGEPPPGMPGVPGARCAGCACHASHPAKRAQCVICREYALNALQLLSCATAWLQIQCPQPIPQPIPQQIPMSYDCFDAVASLMYFQQPYGCGFSLVYIYIYIFKRSAHSASPHRDCMHFMYASCILCLIRGT